MQAEHGQHVGGGLQLQELHGELAGGGHWQAQQRWQLGGQHGHG